MKCFSHDFVHYGNQLATINRLAGDAPQEFILQTEERYHRDLEMIARQIVEDGSSRIVMLAGPSSSGKTTTAHLLARAVQRYGDPSAIISLDDFYRGESNAPVLENGQHDYESLEAIDVPQLQKCLLDLMQNSVCELPVFNFEIHMPYPYTRHVELQKNEIVIVEGLHAMNPEISRNLPQDKLLKMYISVKQGIADGESELISPNDMRLVRRMVRDYNFRCSLPERTFSMWANVLDGERKYIKCYRPDADITINSLHAYEPCVLGAQALPLLRELSPQSVFFEHAQTLIHALERFHPIDCALVPESSMLREFIGGGLFH